MISADNYDKVISLAKAKAELMGMGKDRVDGNFMFTCPLCQGIIEVYISFNGLTHGKCNNKQCVHWIE